MKTLFLQGWCTRAELEIGVMLRLGTLREELLGGGQGCEKTWWEGEKRKMEDLQFLLRQQVLLLKGKVHTVVFHDLLWSASSSGVIAVCSTLAKSPPKNLLVVLSWVRFILFFHRFIDNKPVHNEDMRWRINRGCFRVLGSGWAPSIVEERRRRVGCVVFAAVRKRKKRKEKRIKWSWGGEKASKNHQKSPFSCKVGRFLRSR